jgi:hypothetical protein
MAVRRGYENLFFEGDKTTKQQGLHKDSSTVIYLNRHEDTAKQKFSYDVYITEFRGWLTYSMPQNTKHRWVEADRYKFMAKCVGKNDPVIVKDVITVCSCGGSLLEGKYTLKTVLALTREELLDIIKPCFKYVDVSPESVLPGGR